MSTILEKYDKIKAAWKNKSAEVPYGEIPKKALFELAYHASNEVPLRCIKVITKPGEDEVGNEAVLYSALDKIFIQILGTETGVNITLFTENDADFEKLDKIEAKLKECVSNFNNRSDELKSQIPNTILVERKIDEVVNLATNKDLARKVYFAIGEVRERGALIQLMMSAPKADVVQLAFMKWMNTIHNEDQDRPYPEEKVKGLVKNMLQLKKWVMDLIDRSFTASEEELLPKEVALEE